MRAAEMIDQRAKRARTDILAADEAQPVDPLLVRQADALLRSVTSPPPGPDGRLLTGSIAYNSGGGRVSAAPAS